MLIKSGYEHWWESDLYHDHAQTVEADPLSRNAWRMEEAVAFIYELVRRLSLFEPDLLPEDKQVVSSLPKFPDLDPFFQGILRGALWSSWGVRPVAYSVPGWIASPDFEN